MKPRTSPTPKLVSDSTRKFIRTWRSAGNLSTWDLIHGYIYARWPYLYIGIGKGEHPATRYLNPFFSLYAALHPNHNGSSPIAHSTTVESGTMADGYHGKAVPLENAKKLVMVQQPLRVPDLEQVIPYVRARAILQEAPDHIVVLECPCRSAKENPCLPLGVCLIIGEPFAGFILEHHPQKARQITQDQAAQILEQEDARGHVHHAFFKDAMLGRFYAICNCCACCCGAMHAHHNGTPMLASSGYIAEIDQERCLGCWTCGPYCQFGALKGSEQGISLILVAKCMGCGVCVNQCPEEAISLVLAPEKGVPLEIEKLMQAAGESAS